MGKGDKKTKRGKILMGSHGVRRPRRKLERAVPLVTLKEEKPAEAIKEKAPAKPKPVKEVVQPVKEVVQPVKEVVQVETPIVTVAAEEAVKPARKKTPPKGSAKKE